MGWEALGPFNTPTNAYNTDMDKPRKQECGKKYSKRYISIVPIPNKEGREGL